MANPTGAGGFQKGRSGNPGGQSRVAAELRALAQGFGPEAVETLVAIMRNGETPPAARVSAAEKLLDRGFGKPVQQVTGEGGQPLFAGPITINLVRPGT